MTQKPTYRRILLSRLFSFAILAIPLWMLVVVAKDKEEVTAVRYIFRGIAESLM